MPDPALDEATLSMIRAKGAKWTSDSNNKYPTGEAFNQAYKRTVVMDLRYYFMGRASQRGASWDTTLYNKKGPGLNVSDYETRNKMLLAHNAASS
jgi:hypothetical protein